MSSADTSVAVMRDLHQATAVASGSEPSEPIRLGKPRLLLALLTPIRLLSEVFACDLVCGFNLCMDRRFLTAELRMSL
jgi:hypothetical protein